MTMVMIHVFQLRTCPITYLPSRRRSLHKMIINTRISGSSIPPTTLGRLNTKTRRSFGTNSVIPAPATIIPVNSQKNYIRFCLSMPRFNSPSSAIVPNQIATNTQDRFSFMDLLLLIPGSGSRDKIYNMLCYLLTLVFLEKVSRIMNHYLWLIFRTGDDGTKENISSTCNGVFI